MLFADERTDLFIVKCPGNSASLSEEFKVHRDKSDLTFNVCLHRSADLEGSTVGFTASSMTLTPSPTSSRRRRPRRRPGEGRTVLSLTPRSRADRGFSPTHPKSAAREGAVILDRGHTASFSMITRLVPLMMMSLLQTVVPHRDRLGLIGGKDRDGPQDPGSSVGLTWLVTAAVFRPASGNFS
eukprot:g4376.t1